MTKKSIPFFFDPNKRGTQQPDTMVRADYNLAACISLIQAIEELNKNIKELNNTIKTTKEE